MNNNYSNQRPSANQINSSNQSIPVSLYYTTFSLYPLFNSENQEYHQHQREQEENFSGPNGPNGPNGPYIDYSFLNTNTNALPINFNYTYPFSFGSNERNERNERDERDERNESAPRYVSGYIDFYDLSSAFFPSTDLIERLFNDYVQNKNKLSDEEYKKNVEKINKKLDECPVCFNSSDVTLKIKKCNHSFCEDCIQNWLKNHKNTCPICRIKVNGSNERNERAESNESTESNDSPTVTN